MEMKLIMEELKETGFIVVKDRIQRETAESLALHAMGVKQGEEEHKSGDTIFNSLDPSEYELFLPLINDPLIGEIAKQMLGPGFKLIGDIGRVWSKPGDPAQGLHTDLPVAAWYEENNRPVEYCPTLQIIWVLTDFKKENGATEVIPFSHNSKRGPRDADYERYLMAVEATAGSAIVFHGSLWHRRGKNITADQHRVGISTPYIAKWLDPVSVGWKQIKGSVRDQLPKEVQHLFSHIDESSFFNRDQPKY
jgi:hypothetical protein